jgi:predicted transcriptional regulator
MPKKIVSLRMEPELEQELKQIAENEKRTFSWLAEDLLRRALKTFYKDRKKAKAA